MKEYFAYIYIFFNILIILFHIFLILGAPWGEYTMGGEDIGKLPRHKRIYAILAIPLLIFFLINILSQSNIHFEELKPITDKTIWLVIFLNILTLLGNTFTRSKRERAIWMPITIIMFICALAVAIISK